jgi:hypothetical protein
MKRLVVVLAAAALILGSCRPQEVGEMQRRSEALDVENAQFVIAGLYEAAVDTTLTPPGTQYCATLSNAEQRKPAKYAGFAIPCTPLQHLNYHS